MYLLEINRNMFRKSSNQYVFFESQHSSLLVIVVYRACSLEFQLLRCRYRSQVRVRAGQVLLHCTLPQVSHMKPSLVMRHVHPKAEVPINCLINMEPLPNMGVPLEPRQVFLLLSRLPVLLLSSLLLEVMPSLCDPATLLSKFHRSFLHIPLNVFKLCSNHSLRLFMLRKRFRELTIIQMVVTLVVIRDTEFTKRSKWRRCQHLVARVPIRDAKLITSSD